MNSILLKLNHRTSGSRTNGKLSNLSYVVKKRERERETHRIEHKPQMRQITADSFRFVLVRSHVVVAKCKIGVCLKKNNT